MGNNSSSKGRGRSAGSMRPRLTAARLAGRRVGNAAQILRRNPPRRGVGVTNNPATIAARIAGRRIGR